MKKFGKFLGCFLPLIAALVCQIVISFSFTFVYSFYLGMKAGILGIPAAEQEQFFMDSLSSGNVLMIITAIATAATLLIGACWYHSYKPKTDFKLKELVNGKLLAAMVCLGLSLQFLISTCLSVVYPILPQNLTDQYAELMEQLIGGNIWLSLLVTVILAPLAEELLFRGVTMKMAQKVMPFMAANILQAVLFGVYHMNWIQGVYAFVLGMILGFTAEYFHSVWASILLHAFVNASAEVISNLPEAFSESLAGTVCIAVVGVVLLFVAAKLYPTAKKEPAVEEIPVEIQENEIFRENSFDE